LNLPPSIDNATLARRRRRRTSARDQAILEEEYRLCDRPDKARRREITSKVDMGEKEVQVSTLIQFYRREVRGSFLMIIPISAIGPVFLCVFRSQLGVGPTPADVTT
jgi:hypothetical protein